MTDPIVRLLKKPTISIKSQAQVADERIYQEPSKHYDVIDIRDRAKRDNQQGNLNSQITGYLAKAIEHIRAESTRTDPKVDEKAKKNIGFRIRSLQKAIDVLSNYPEQIKTSAQALELPGIGKGIARRIEEILKTGRLAEIDTQEDQYVRLVKELTNISGIGLVKAKNLIETYKISSLDDLIAKYQSGQLKLGKNQLTHHQVVGLRYARDLDQKIPRAEIDLIVEPLRRAIANVDSRLIFEICGSYRRKKAISGDIDVLVSTIANLEKPIETYNFLPQIVVELNKSGLILDNLTEAGQTKYMGVCRIIEIARRIDIRVLLHESYATALLYFTGSGNFNQLSRAVALQRGYTISEYAVCPLVEGEKGPPIPVKTERDIFDLIGIKYLTPEEREL